MLKEKTELNAFSHLMGKHGKKGEELNYSSLEMSEYILPINNHITTEEKCEIFAMKTRMIKIPNNSPNNNKQTILVET